MDTGFNRDNEIRRISDELKERRQYNPVKELINDIEDAIYRGDYNLIIIESSDFNVIQIPAEDVGNLKYNPRNNEVLIVKTENSLRYIPINQLVEIKLINYDS